MEPFFHLETMQYPDKSILSAPTTQWDKFPNFEEAFHRLMIEMMRWQVGAIGLAAGNTQVRKLFVDGGFSQSDVFIHLLRRELPEYELIVSTSPLGSSLGVAMAIQEPERIEKYPFETRRVLMS